jgi:hypothetical protein
MRLLPIYLMIASFAMVDPAHTQLRGSTDASPVFSEADRTVIERNETLRSIVKKEPALVRRVLDALAEIEEVQMRAGPMTNNPRATRTPSGRPAGQPSSNPDLDRLERASPEAMNDLFQLLKRASGNRPRPSR